MATQTVFDLFLSKQTLSNQTSWTTIGLADNDQPQISRLTTRLVANSKFVNLSNCRYLLLPVSCQAMSLLHA